MMVISLKRYIILLSSFLFLSSVCTSQNNRDEYSKNSIAKDETVRYGRLDNGFTYYLKKHKSIQKKVIMELVVKAGLYLEDSTQVEYSHLLEHVGLFNTTNYPDLQLLLKDEGIGSHAQTEYFSTKYQLTVPEINPRKMELGLDVLKDISSEISLNPENVKFQQGSLLGEFRTNNPYQDNLLFSERKFLASSLNVPFPSKDQITQSISNYSLKALKRFYNDWYRPDLQSIIIVGDIQPDSLEIIVKEKFSGLKVKSAPKNPDKYLKGFPVRLSGENQYDSMSDSINTESRLLVYSKEKNYSYSIRSENDYHKMITQNLYKEIVYSRAKELLRQNNPPFSNFVSEFSPYLFGGGQVDITRLEVNLEGSTQEFEEQLKSALKARKIIYSNFTELELKKAKEAISESLSNYSPGIIQMVKDYNAHFIKGSELPNPDQPSKLLEIIDRVTLDEVQRHATIRSGLLNNLNFIFVNPPKRLSDWELRIKEILNWVEVEKIPLFQSPQEEFKALDYNLEDKLESNTNIYKISENLIGVTSVELNNGIRLLLKPSLPESEYFRDQIEILGFKSIPYQDNSGNELRYKKIAHDYASFSGTKDYNRFQIEQFKTKCGISLRFDTQENDFLIEGKFKKDVIKEFFKLFYLKLESPEQNHAVIKSWIKDRKSHYNDYAVRSGSIVFDREINKLWYPNRNYFTSEIFNNFNTNELLNAYEKHFSNFQGYTFIITGDFETKTFVPEISNYLSVLPAKFLAGVRGNKIFKFPLQRRDSIIKVRNLNQAVVRIYIPIVAPNDLKTQAILDLIATSLNERIYKKLRLGSYSPKATGYWINKKDSLYTFEISFDSDLGNEKKMISNAIEEFNNIRKLGLNEKWLQNRIPNKKDRFYGKLSSFGYFNFWPGYLKKQVQNDENIERPILEYGTLLENFIDQEDVDNVIENHLTTNYLQQFVFLPK